MSLVVIGPEEVTAESSRPAARSEGGVSCTPTSRRYVAKSTRRRQYPELWATRPLGERCLALSCGKILELAQRISK